MDFLTAIYDTVETGGRLTAEDGRRLLTEAELLDLSTPATIVRQRLHPGRRVTFHVDTNPNYSNICDTLCTYCAFYRTPKQEGAYRLTVDEVMEKIERAVAWGARTVLLQGGHYSKISLDYYLDLVRETRRRFPQVLPHFFSAPEIHAMGRYFKMPVREVLQQLYDAGQRTIPGGGAEVLSQRVRDALSPRKATVEEWLEVHETAHRIGFKTTCTMMYGHIETPEEIVQHLLLLREVQDRTGGFYAFIPWSFKPGDTPLSASVPVPAPDSLYLRIIALARLLLDNIPHIQASWFSEGRKTGQLALEFGADDFGGTLIEESVLQCAGHHNTTTTDEVIHVIHDAGYVPVERDTLYNIVRVYDEPERFRSRVSEKYRELV